MSQLTTRLPDDLVARVEKAAWSLNCTRAEIVRQALDSYLAGLEVYSASPLGTRCPDLDVLDWDEVEHRLIGRD
jgi:transposase